MVNGNKPGLYVVSNHLPGPFLVGCFAFQQDPVDPLGPGRWMGKSKNLGEVAWIDTQPQNQTTKNSTLVEKNYKKEAHFDRIMSNFPKLSHVSVVFASSSPKYIRITH